MVDQVKKKLEGLQAGQQVIVDIKDAKQRECVCGSKFFRLVMTVWTISALVSPTGQKLQVQQPVLICTKCEEVLQDE